MVWDRVRRSAMRRAQSGVRAPDGRTPVVDSRLSETAPRTPWGEPDIQGLFTTDDELGVPFERPEQLGARETVTDAEFKDREAQAARQAAADAEEFVAPRAAAAEVVVAIRGGGGSVRLRTGSTAAVRRAARRS